MRLGDGARVVKIKFKRRSVLAAIDQEFAAKIAAAHMMSPRDQLPAIIVALHVEMAQRKQALSIDLKAEQVRQRVTRPKRPRRKSRPVTQELFMRVLQALAFALFSADVMHKLCYLSILV